MVQVNHNGGSPDGKTTEQTQKTTIFRLKAYGSGASDRLNAFVDKAFAWLKQKKQEEQLANNKRMFFLAVSNEKKDNEKKGFEFKQYPLSDHKTFKSLFFPEKEALMSLVEDFMNRRGKFCIEGFPQKLGILLDGPPGTGKTSLIKALAQHTNRHIVSVNLAKVKTNQELMDLMFDLVFPVQGGDVPLKLRFSDVIFVMEDVDAASKVVYARQETKRKAKSLTKPQQSNLSRQTSTEAEAAAGVLQAVAGDEVCTPKHNSGAEELVGQVAGVLAAAMSEMSATTPCASTSDCEGEVSKRGPLSICGPRPKWFEPDDELNLTGLLNVIDGVVDAPGRILVMTTNHPEKLDPALIRPGRINKKMHLGCLDLDCFCSMVSHYLATEVNNAQRKELSLVAAHVTPATVEQLCAEVNSVEELCKGLQQSL